MYAVIRTGGKQYRLKQGELIQVESLKGAVGDKITFHEVLALGDENTASFGSPLVEGARVIGTIVEHGKGGKVRVLKFKRRKMYRKRTGHRQGFTSVKIDSILAAGEAETAVEETVKPVRKTTRKRPVASKAEEKTGEKTVVETRKAKSAAKKIAAKGEKRSASAGKSKPRRKSKSDDDSQE